MNLQQAFQAALLHHQSGRLPDAESLYRQILAAEPSHPDALHLLGVIAHQVGQHSAAIQLIQQAISLAPNSPDFYSNLGEACRASGQHDNAIAAYRHAITLKPDYAEAYSNLGVAFKDAGQLDDAITACSHAITLKADYAEAYSNLGVAFKDAGRVDEAIAAYRQAIALKPDFPDALCNLGSILTNQGRLNEAIASYRQAIALKPDFPLAHHNLGIAFVEAGRLDEAADAYRQAIALQPGMPGAYCNLGNVLTSKGQPDEAVAAYRQAIALKPDIPEAHNNLGAGLRDQGRLDEAITSYLQAIALDPDYAEAHSNLGTAFKDAGRLDEALDCYRRSIALNPARPDFHSNLLLALNYHPDLDARLVAEEHRRWDRLHAEPLRSLISPHPNDRSPDRPLRIGYVSPDLREHVVARFLLPLLEHHDRSSFEIFAYAQIPVPDAVSHRIRSLSHAWRSLVGLSDAQAADLIRSDRIDILVDLAGHTAANRLMVFARKPAPVQVSWLGYPNTTGLQSIDYRLTDALADPPGLTDSLCSEKLFRLSHSAWCFQPVSSPPPPPRPDGPITFASFNNFAKVNHSTLALWARILLSVPHSRLLLKASGLASSSAQHQLRLFFESLGIHPSRLDLRTVEPDYLAHLSLYHHADIALDTFPYHGTSSSCEALWMGLPVVSLSGHSHVPRVGTSLLSNIGLPELIAHSPSDYVHIASSLALDPPRLALLRSSLRSLMLASPLMLPAPYALNIETAFRSMWTHWCSKPA